jgi:glycine cleavage system aminomethyltransferase T
LQPYHVTAMKTLRLEKGYPLYGNDVHGRWVGTRARLRGRHSVSEGHTVGKMLAVAYAESFHAGPGIRLVLAVKGRPRVATATTTPFFDPQDMRLRT